MSAALKACSGDDAFKASELKETSTCDVVLSTGDPLVDRILVELVKLEALRGSLLASSPPVGSVLETVLTKVGKLSLLIRQAFRDEYPECVREASTKGEHAFLTRKIFVNITAALFREVHSLEEIQEIFKSTYARGERTPTVRVVFEMNDLSQYIRHHFDEPEDIGDARTMDHPNPVVAAMEQQLHDSVISRTPPVKDSEKETLAYRRQALIREHRVQQQLLQEIKKAANDAEDALKAFDRLHPEIASQ